MQPAFLRTLRPGNAGSNRATASGLLALVLIAAWSAWGVLARVTVRETTVLARLEVGRAAYPIQSPAAGRVIGTWLAAGRPVNAGDVLVELDDSEEQLRVGEHQTRLAMLTSQVEALERDIARERQDTRHPGRENRIQSLEAEIARVEAGIAASRASIERLDNDIQHRVLRAPAPGRLDGIAPLKPGALLPEGARVATLIPEGHLMVVAQFPKTVLGRIAPGQPGVIRLNGMPWARYGKMPATVARVAAQRDGSVRVEMALPACGPCIQLQPGLSGSVEVEVERSAPAAVILRTAVRFLASSGSALGAAVKRRFFSRPAPDVLTGES